VVFFKLDTLSVYQVILLQPLNILLPLVAVVVVLFVVQVLGAIELQQV